MKIYRWLKMMPYTADVEMPAVTGLGNHDRHADRIN